MSKGKSFLKGLVMIILAIILILVLVACFKFASLQSGKQVEAIGKQIKNGEFDRALSERLIYLTGFENESAYFLLSSVGFKSEEEPGWKFLVNGESIDVGYYKIDGSKIIITVIGPSGQIVDLKDITKYVRKGDLIYAGYIGSPTEEVAIYVKHGDGFNFFVNPVKIEVNIEEPVNLKKLI